MMDLFAQLDQHPEPPLPPGHLEQTLAKARVRARRDRRNRFVTAAFIAIVLGLAGYVLPGQLTGPASLAPAEAVVLPDRIAGYRLLTAPVGKHPAGEALMLFESGSWENFTTIQDLLLHTDGRTYRDVEELRGGREALLSPDGSALLIADSFGPTKSFLHLDLRTGESRQIPLNTPAGVKLLAWSPDGRQVAYSQVPWTTTEASNAIELETRATGTLTVVDLTTGNHSVYPEIIPAAAASFGPGGDQLAVQMGAVIKVINLPDGLQRQIQPTAGEGLGIVPGVSWSPDGRLLALVPWHDLGGGILQPSVGFTNNIGNKTITFIDATGAGRAVPSPITAGELLGWRTPDILLARNGLTIVEASLQDGSVKPISSFEQPHTCELGTQTCTLYPTVQVATGLLNGMVVKPAESPLRGPWPVWLQLVTAVTTVLIGFLLFRLTRRFRRGRVGVWP